MSQVQTGNAQGGQGTPPTPSRDTKRALLGAALSLFGFSLFTSLALAAHFKSAIAPWGWRTLLAFLCAALAMTAAALVWRAPSRAHVFAGIAVVLLSLVRLGAPSEWGFASFVVIVPTALFVIPLVRAAIVLSRA